MCMNKSIMSPEFMSGALRNHKQTQFLLHSPTGPHQKITHPPPPATGSVYGPGPSARSLLACRQIYLEGVETNISTRLCYYRHARDPRVVNKRQQIIMNAYGF